MQERSCESCGKPISPERLEVLPDTTTCPGCSKVKKKLGFMVSAFSKGTAPALVTVDPDDSEQTRLAHRANARRR